MLWLSPDSGSADHAAKFTQFTSNSVGLMNNCNYPQGRALFFAVWVHLTWCALRRKDASWLQKGWSMAPLKSVVTKPHLACLKSQSWPTSCPPPISSDPRGQYWEWVWDALPNEEWCSILEHLNFSVKCFSVLKIVRGANIVLEKILEKIVIFTMLVDLFSECWMYFKNHDP